MTKSFNKIRNISQKALTFSLNYAILILGYIGIVVYLDGLKSAAKLGKLTRQNKKQNKITYQLLAGQALSGASVLKAANLADQFNSNLPLFTFCFLSKRFFIKRSKTKKQKIKINSNDSRLLSIKRHFAANRSQQNDVNSLGRSGLNSQGFARQSWLALLFQRTSRRNHSTRSGYQLLSRNGWRSNKLRGTRAGFTSESRVKSLKFLLIATAKYDLVETKQKFSYWLGNISSRFSVFTRPLSLDKGEINIQTD
ncbi:MAG: hypothetical protein PHW95_01670 [Patescibacteria group bacterium]|nr:hypothetical protein [Patescibacteria group bacterium]